jgi:2-haloacid dehalogenase
MAIESLKSITTLTFDVFGTVLDLTGSLVPPTQKLMAELGSEMTGEDFWAQWRARQRVEQYQDSMMMLGHSGYLETCRRALAYCLRANDIQFNNRQIDRFMQVWQNLRPYEDSVRGLDRLQGKYRLVALSNGEPWFLKHLADNRIKFEFHRIISVEEAGFFKPHPSVYRTAARLLDSEPSEILMVAAHAFDIMGARVSGYRGVYVNRYGLPYEDTTQYKPDMVVDDFDGLANALLDG